MTFPPFLLVALWLCHLQFYLISGGKSVVFDARMPGFDSLSCVSQKAIILLPFFSTLFGVLGKLKGNVAKNRLLRQGTGVNAVSD